MNHSCRREKQFGRARWICPNVQISKCTKIFPFSS